MFFAYFLHLYSYLLTFLQGTAFVSFSSVTSTLKLKTHSQLTQSPFTGSDSLLSSLSRNKVCVDQSSSVRNVTNVPTVVPNLPVGARLHELLKKWEVLGVSTKVLTVPREGYTFSFRFQPNLTRLPTPTSCYVNPHRNLYLLEAFHQLLNKNAVELVKNQESLGFYNWIFLVPQPNNRSRPILNISNLNKFLNTEPFKMETPNTIRTSLQAGEGVTSIDFKDAYFHIPICSQSRKYMRFHIHDKCVLLNVSI